jgi:hypothetical protein
METAQDDLEPVGGYPSPSTIWRALIIYCLVVCIACACFITRAFAAPSLEDVAKSPNTFVACKAVDIASTAYLLRTGVGVEGNPIVAPLIAHGYFPLFLVSVGIYWVMTKFTTPTSNVVINGVTCAVAAHNLLLIP